MDYIIPTYKILYLYVYFYKSRFSRKCYFLFDILLAKNIEFLVARFATLLCTSLFSGKFLKFDTEIEKNKYIVRSFVSN